MEKFVYAFFAFRIYIYYSRKADYFGKNLSTITSNIGQWTASIFNNLKYLKAISKDKLAKEESSKIFHNFAASYENAMVASYKSKFITELLLLSPAGLAGKNPKIPWPFNHLGAFFLSQPFVRRGLCRQAFADPTNSVGPAEEQIASIHLKVPGWQSSLADFAADGGVSGCGLPKPTQPLKIILGKYDRIIPKNEKEETRRAYNSNIEIATNSGHLPHLEEPKLVAEAWAKLKI